MEGRRDDQGVLTFLRLLKAPSGQSPNLELASCRSDQKHRRCDDSEAPVSLTQFNTNHCHTK